MATWGGAEQHRLRGDERHNQAAGALRSHQALQPVLQQEHWRCGTDGRWCRLESYLHMQSLERLVSPAEPRPHQRQQLARGHAGREWGRWPVHAQQNMCLRLPAQALSRLLAPGGEVSQVASQGTAGPAPSQGAAPVSSASGAPVQLAEPVRTSSNSSQSQDEILKGALGDTQARVLRKAEQNKRAQQRHRQKQKVGSC